MQNIDGQPAVWLDGDQRRDVVGEEFQAEHLNRLVAWLKNNPGLHPVAWLMPEPSNKYDPNAVQVWMCGGVVGYLPRFLAALWQPAIVAMRAAYNGMNVACAAEIEEPESGDWVSSPGVPQVVLTLPWLPGAKDAAKPSPKAKRQAISTSIASVSIGLKCIACKAVMPVPFEDIRMQQRVKCACGVPIPYEPSDIKGAIDELRDMSTLLKIAMKGTK